MLGMARGEFTFSGDARLLAQVVPGQISQAAPVGVEVTNDADMSNAPGVPTHMRQFGFQGG